MRETYASDSTCYSHYTHYTHYAHYTSYSGTWGLEIDAY